jgi:hypothetical protein
MTRQVACLDAIWTFSGRILVLNVNRKEFSNCYQENLAQTLDINRRRLKSWIFSKTRDWLDSGFGYNGNIRGDGVIAQNHIPEVEDEDCLLRWTNKEIHILLP